MCWFRKDRNSESARSRVLAWIFGRCQGKAEAGEGRRAGLLPSLGEEGIDAEGLGVPRGDAVSPSR